MEEGDKKTMLVSICIPCYNAALFLPETLASLLHQSYQDLEIIIIDDHSTDESVKIIKEFAVKDHRIHLEIANSKGAAAARNQAYQLCKGDYIVFFDADDWVPENFITSQLQTLKSDQEVVVAKWGRFYQNDISTVKVDPSQIEQNLYFEDWIIEYWTTVSHMTCPGRVLMPKNLIAKSELWKENLSLNDDFAFYTGIFSNCSIIRYNPKSLFYYRSGVNGLSALKSESGYHSLYQSLQMGICIAEKKFPNSSAIKLACANLLQNFIYDVYNKQPKLLNEASAKIKALGGSNLIFTAGGKTKILTKIIGWKLAKILNNSFK